MNKFTYILIALVVFITGFLYFTKEDKVVVLDPLVPIVENKKIELCFAKSGVANSRGYADQYFLHLFLDGPSVSGELKLLPAEKDSKVGSFTGVVGPVDKIAMARTANLWWDTLAEGMNTKEELKIVFGEGNADIGFGEMVDRGDGVYVYKDPSSIAYDLNLTDVACANLSLVGRNCYKYEHIATVAEPYTVKESIDVTRVGNKITGNKKGTQEGPDMTNGYTGTLTGSVGEDTMETLFSYVIEGSKQKEKELYNIGENSLIKFRYALTEEKGVLVPDLNTTPKQMIYTKVSCSLL